MTEVFVAKLPSDDCQLISQMINQHWFRYWLGAVRQQTITRDSVGQDLCRHIMHMAPLGHNNLTTTSCPFNLPYVFVSDGMTNMADCEPLIPVDMNQDYRTTMYTKLRTFRDPSQSREPSSDEVSFYSYSYDYQSRSIDDSLEHKKCCSFKTRCPGITIEPIVFIYILCLGIIRYAAQDYLVLSIRKDSNATLSDNSTASEYDLFISQFHGVDMVYVIRIIGLYLPGIIIAFFIGAVSDKYGRRLVLFFPSVGILLHSLITLVVVWGRLPSWLLLFAAILDGCFGGPCIMTTGLYGYLSHITIKEHRLENREPFL